MKLPKFKHGIVRGLDSVASSPAFEGRFGRMFRTLQPANHTHNDLLNLARINDGNIGGMTSSDDPNSDETDNPRDDEENTGIHAGYTYLGQFIDHDLTFDPSTLAQQKSDPDAIVDYRTPKFDLDNMYGRGPDDQPYLYDFHEDGTIKMLLGKKLNGSSSDSHTHDLPRNNPLKNGRAYALIGDKRNDENVIVSQLQGMFLRFHNRMVDYHKRKGLDPGFEAVQKAVRLHYQWVVLNDFLPTIIGKAMLHEICPHLRSRTNILADKPNLMFYHWKNTPFMPVEFSVAAYRFGHSMVRPIYRLNTNIGRKPIFPELLAFGEFNPEFAIDWKLFFDFGKDAYTSDPDHPGVDVQFTKHRIQPAYKIDTSLVNPLSKLPPPITGERPPSLAALNLFRGLKLKLPSGQAVARAMGIEPLLDEQLPIGKANTDGMGPGTTSGKKNKIITDISKNFAGNAPLWFYILAEAQQYAFENASKTEKKFTNDTPIRLGPVGGRIVGEVFVGLLYGDSSSILNHPLWEPYADFLTIDDKNPDGKFGIAELLKQAQQAQPVYHD